MGRWYLRPAYLFRYTLREFTAVFVLVQALILLAGLVALVAGPEAWAGFLGLLSHPLMIGLSGALLLAALYNSVTWFLVAPKAMPPIFVGTRPVPDRVIVLAHLIVFVIVSVLIVGLLAGGAT